MWELTQLGKLGALITALAVTSTFAGCHGCHGKREAAEAEAKRKADPLYVPCLNKLVSELASADASDGMRDIPCAGGRLSVTSKESDEVTFFFGDASKAPAASLVRRRVAAVLPNLGPPARSAAYPCRHVIAGTETEGTSPEDKLVRGLLAYRMAAGIVADVEKMGGNRWATWSVPGAEVQVEGSPVAAEGFPIVLRVRRSPRPPPDTLEDAPWNDESICRSNESPSAADLRHRMMADGWWQDDAKAFLAAARAIGAADDTTVSAPLGVIARFLLATKNWDSFHQSMVAQSCITPALKGAATGVARAFDLASHADDHHLEVLLAPPARPGIGALFASQEGAVLETSRFVHMIKTPIHARCALDHMRGWNGRTWRESFAIARFFREENLDDTTWGPAHKLLSDARFPNALSMELAKARADLLRSGVATNPASSAVALAARSKPLTEAAATSTSAVPVESALAPEDKSFVDTRGGAGWGDRCWIHLKANHLAAARAACERGLALEPTSPQPRASLLYNLGLVAKSQGRKDEARTLLTESIGLRPHREAQAALDSL